MSGLLDGRTREPDPAGPSAPSLGRLAGLLTGVALVLDALALALLVPQSGDALANLDSSTIGGYVLGATFPIVGWVIASRRPANSIGWIFLGIGLSQALDTFVTEYAHVGLVAHPGWLPAADLMCWVEIWAWAPGFVLLLTAAILLFPDGRPPSPRWRAVFWVAAAALFLLVVPVAIVGWPSRGVELLGSEPSTSTDPVLSAMLALQLVGLVLLVVAGLTSVTGLLVRFRRSTGIERAQLKWFAAAGAVEVVILIASAFVQLPGLLLNVLLSVVVAPLLPIAAAIAILRYRLYDIDRIVSRTIAYTAISAVLLAVFAGAILLSQSVLAPLTGGGPIAVAASTLLVAALFQPLRGRVQGIVDRRFNRARYDAEAIVTGFVGNVRDQVELDALVDEVVVAARRSVAPASVSVWLREGSGR